jgi:hypothetical protein
MSFRIAAVGLLLAAAVGPGVAPRVGADEPSREEAERLQRLRVVEQKLADRLRGADDARKAAKAEPDNLNDLSLEVTALQTLYQFRLTPAQLETLRKLAKETAPKSYAAKEVKASADLRKTLSTLRGALLAADEDQVTRLSDRLDEVMQKENFEPDEVEVTEAAQRRAPEVLRLLSARQVAYYVSSDPGTIPDPLELLTDALGKVRKLEAQDWKDLRDDVSERVGLLLAGFDDARADKVSEDVVDLLIKARGLTDDEFKAQRKNLEKAARDIIGEVGPTDVLRNVLERALAELLSNPRLPAALDAQLKK